jgi:transcriptional regulator GlxA family with amidase domain
MSGNETSAMVILFVYNADSGAFTAAKDFLHKIASPASYECRLCGITYGTLGMKSEWREFLEGLGHSVEFLHRDEFREKFPGVNYRFPAAFIMTDHKISPWISAEEINECNTMDELIEVVSRKIEFVPDGGVE